MKHFITEGFTRFFIVLLFSLLLLANPSYANSINSPNTANLSSLGKPTVSLNTDPVSPQGKNSIIKITTTSQNIPDPLYKYWIFESGTWRTLREYAPEPSISWKPIKEGKYGVAVWVKSKESSTSSYDIGTGLNYYIISRPTGPPKKNQLILPGDIIKKHEKVITDSKTQYTIKFDGKIDGTMTRGPIGYGPYNQGFQPNIRVRLTNEGDTDIVNPRLVVNDKRDWFDVTDLVNRIISPYSSELEKALAIWYFQQSNRFHATTWDKEVQDPIKMLNVYGYTLCNDDSSVLADLLRTTGLQTRTGHPVAHSTTEVFFDNSYHLLDGDRGVFAFLRDNKTIASEDQIVHDRDLLKRVHAYNILQQDNRAIDELNASLYSYHGIRKTDHESHTGHTMNYTLRPNEWIEWRWDHIGKQYTAGKPMTTDTWTTNGEGDLLAAFGQKAHDKLCNGRMYYCPDLNNVDIAKKGTLSYINTIWSTSEELPMLYPENSSMPSSITWKIKSPYVIVGGNVEIGYYRKNNGNIEILVSEDGAKWNRVWTSDENGTQNELVDLDKFLSSPNSPQYQYFIKVNMKNSGFNNNIGLNHIAFDTDIQMAPLSLPELEVGLNNITYTDDTNSLRKVSVLHEWIERKSITPPEAPKEPIFPVDGDTVNDTKFSFKWMHPKGNNSIIDYQFQLSAYPDMRWPLSPNFNKLVSLTPDKGKAQWTVPYIGLLNPSTTYYWRVRALNSEGIWGPWSKTWSFQCQAPGVPLNVSTSFDHNSGTVTLSWKPNTTGTSPIRYKVYASNEKGFTANDNEYLRYMGHGFCSSVEDYINTKNLGMVKTPSNLLTTSNKTNLIVVSSSLSVPNANKAYYRVVALDKYGNESGPSDYAETPRPFIYTRPLITAQVGKQYIYKPQSINSIGDLTTRITPVSHYSSAFWDKESIKFSLKEAPHWLNIRSNGEIKGVPDQKGIYNVVLVAHSSKGTSSEQNFQICVE